MSTDAPMTVDQFNEQLLAAIRAGGPMAPEKVRRIAERAVKNPNLLDRFKEHWNKGEYHVQRNPECAVKAFNFDGSMKQFSTAHDHAGFWAVYIIFKGRMETRFYQEVNPGRLPWPGLTETGHLVLDAGDSMILTPQDIHSVFSSTPGTVALTIYNGDLNASVRRIYDYRNEIFIEDRSQWEARKRAGAYGVGEGGKLRKLEASEIIDEA